MEPKFIKKRLVYKVFVRTLILIISSFIVLFLIQDYFINNLYMTYKINTMRKHIIETGEKIEDSGDHNSLNQNLINEIESSRIFSKTYIQLYSNNNGEHWKPQLDWINSQLFSSYYVEYNNEFYKLSFDKYTGEVYKREKLEYDISKDLAKEMILANNFDLIDLVLEWKFDGKESVYITKNSNDTISLTVIFKHIDLSIYDTNFFNSDIVMPNKMEFIGKIISGGYEPSIDWGYAYISKFLGEKIGSFIVNSDQFEREGLHINSGKDIYTGTPYTIFINSIIIDGEEYYLMYLTFFDNLNFLNPFSKLNLIIVIAALCISAVFVYVYTSIVTRPILKIRQATNELANLNFGVKCEVDTEDEIEELAMDINEMARKLEINTDKLNAELDKMKELESFRKLFIAAASHEFRTPLTIMRGILESYNDGIFDAKDKDPFKIMEFEVMQLENIVNEIITISKSEVKTMNYTFNHFQLDDLVQINLNRYQYILNEKNITVIKCLDDGFIFGDEDKISLVIKNVLSNAIKYSPNDKCIMVDVREINNKMVFSVENRGSKIDESIIPMIWEPFYRESKSAKTIPGFGIGLYTTKLILTAHKVKFDLENTEEGVRFYFEFDKIEG